MMSLSTSQYFPHFDFNAFQYLHCSLLVAIGPLCYIISMTTLDSMINLFRFRAPNKPITLFHHININITRLIALSWWLFSTISHQSRQCRSKIRLHILCSLILIYTGCKGNYSFERRFQGFYVI